MLTRENIIERALDASILKRSNDGAAVAEARFTTLLIV